MVYALFVIIIRNPLRTGPERDILRLSPTEYESWVRTYGSKAEIIAVEKQAGGLYSGGKLPT
jgi:hypothetical protein